MGFLQFVVMTESFGGYLYLMQSAQDGYWGPVIRDRNICKRKDGQSGNMV